MVDDKKINSKVGNYILLNVWTMQENRSI